MCSHHLIEPVACTPASGWEKGQVENQVGLFRERLFTPQPRFKTLDELNAWLLDSASPTPKRTGIRSHRATVWEVFEADDRARSLCRPVRQFHAVPASVSKTCLVRFDNNKYSVTASAVGRPVEVHAYADRIVIRQDGRIVAEHPARSVAAIPSTIPGITCRCWLANPVPCATALPSRTGCCQRRSNVYHARLA